MIIYRLSEHAIKSENQIESVSDLNSEIARTSRGFAVNAHSDFSLPFHRSTGRAVYLFLLAACASRESDKNLEFKFFSLFSLSFQCTFFSCLSERRRAPLLTISVYRKVNFSFSFQMLFSSLSLRAPHGFESGAKCSNDFMMIKTSRRKFSSFVFRAQSSAPKHNPDPLWVNLSPPNLMLPRRNAINRVRKTKEKFTTLTDCRPKALGRRKHLKAGNFTN